MLEDKASLTLTLTVEPSDCLVTMVDQLGVACRVLQVSSWLCSEARRTLKNAGLHCIMWSAATWCLPKLLFSLKNVGNPEFHSVPTLRWLQGSAYNYVHQ